jgi:hypothetical protein
MKKKMSKNTNLGTIHQIGVMRCNSINSKKCYFERKHDERNHKKMIYYKKKNDEITTMNSVPYWNSGSFEFGKLQN